MDAFFQVLVQNRTDAVVMLDGAGAMLFAGESARRIGG